MASTITAASSLSSVAAISGAVSSVSNGSRVTALFSGGKKTAPKKAAKKVTAERPLWFPGANPPAYLDGSLIGDNGFDPLRLGKPAEYVQFELDSLDQNLAKNEFGDVISSFVSGKTEVAATPFQPYNEVFSIVRFRENEVIHGRWAMLFIVGALSVESLTGVTWQDAGKVELEQGASYFGLPLPFSLSALVVIETLLVGYIEFARNSELDTEKRLYPGGAFFDPLKLATDPEKLEGLKLAELKHCRLAMMAALGFAAQAGATGAGPLENWAVHLSDPLHTTIFDTFSG